MTARDRIQLSKFDGTGAFAEFHPATGYVITVDGEQRGWFRDHARAVARVDEMRREEEAMEEK